AVRRGSHPARPAADSAAQGDDGARLAARGGGGGGVRVRNRAAALLLAAAALSTAEPYAAEAQHIPSPYRHIEPAQSLSLYSGYLSTSRGDVGIGLASGPTIGLRYAGRIAAPVAGIARLSMTPSERTIFGRENVNDPAS